MGYLKDLKNRPPHEKRRFSLQAASGIMAVIFLVWLSTLGMRLAQGAAGTSGSPQVGGALTAGVAAAGSGILSEFGHIKTGLQAVERLGSTVATTTDGGGSSDASTTVVGAPPATPLSGAQVTSGAGADSETVEDMPAL